MIHTARQSSKFKRFVRWLRPVCAGCPIDVETLAVGLLERIWHIAMVEARRGDIGRIDNETICELAGWHGDEDEFIAALIHCGWLDESDEHRLIVHDWHEHAPRFIKQNIGRLGGFVSTREIPPSDETVSEDLPSQPRRKAATPNPTKQNPTKQNPTKQNPTKQNPTKHEPEPSTAKHEDLNDKAVDESGASPEAVFETWNASAAKARVRVLTQTRREKLRLRLADPEWPWREAIDKLPIPNTDRFTWQPDFDWLISNDTNAWKIVDGKYENNARGSPRSGRGGQVYEEKTPFGEGF